MLRTCCTLLKQSYSSFLAGGTWYMGTTSVEIDLGVDRVVLHLWVMPLVLGIGVSCQDLGRIMVRLVSPYNTNVVCILYCLLGSLVIMHDNGAHGTHTLSDLVVHESCMCS